MLQVSDLELSSRLPEGDQALPQLAFVKRPGLANKSSADLRTANGVSEEDRNGARPSGPQLLTRCSGAEQEAGIVDAFFTLEFICVKFCVGKTCTTEFPD